MKNKPITLSFEEWKKLKRIKKMLFQVIWSVGCRNSDVEGEVEKQKPWNKGKL